MDESEGYYDYDTDYEELPRDPKTDEAKQRLIEFFRQRPTDVFYLQQLKVRFEREFFHWITGRALGELVAEGRIYSQRLELQENTTLVRLRGGFTLIIEWQLYPFGQGDLVRRVREATGLLVDSPTAIREGTVARFLRWHRKQL